MVASAVGPYCVVRELGAGAMGSVWLAERGDSKVALKIIHPHLVASEEARRRFLREGQIGMRVRHANVVSTLQVGETTVDSRPSLWLAMEYVEGRTLRSLLEELGRVPEVLCRHIGHEIAAGLAAIHAAGTIHRDVKPENVLLTADGQVVKLTDFGLAKDFGSAAALSESGAFQGTVLYASPEQFRRSGGEPDARSDLHALGIVLYELATGRHPYAASDLPEAIDRILHAAPRPMHELNPRITPFFEELVHTLLAKDRGARFHDAAGLAAVLEDGEGSAWWQERAARIRIATNRAPRRAAAVRETALHGRDGELGRLERLFSRARAGDGCVGLVVGETGMGKTRLLEEFTERLRRSGQDVEVLCGAWPPPGEPTPCCALASAMRDRFGDEGVEDAVAGHLGGWSPLVHSAAAWIRGDAPDAGAAPLSESALRDVLVRTLRGLASARPAVLVVDDLEFAPEDGRERFAALTLAVPGHRMLLLGAAGPGLPAAWTDRLCSAEHVARIELGPLSARDVGGMLAESLGSRPAADDLAEAVAARTCGRPSFVLEVLRTLRRDDGAGPASRASVAGIDVPSLDALVRERIEALAPEDRRLLETAACAGSPIDAHLLAALSGAGYMEVLRRLAGLEKSSRVVSAGGQGFVFESAHVREALSAGIAPEERRRLHARIAAAIDARGAKSAGGADLVPGADSLAIAEHALRGDCGELALRHLDRALDHLEARHLNDPAARLAQSALAAPGLVTGARRAALLLRLARRLDLLGRRDAEREALDEALAIAVASGDLRTSARARRALGARLVHLSRFDEAEPVLLRAVDEARAAFDRRTEAAATEALGNALRGRGRLALAREVFERQIEIAREAGDRAMELGASGNLCAALRNLGRIEEAIERMRRDLDAARDLGDVGVEARTLGGLGAALRSLGRFAEARELHERELELARDTADRGGEMRANANLGLVLDGLGRSAEALSRHDRSLALAREIGDRRAEAVALMCLGWVRTRLGRTRDARELLDRSLRLARSVRSRFVEALALDHRGRAADEAGDARAAERDLDAALGLRRETGHREGEADSLLARGALFGRLGRGGEAQGDLAAALGIAREVGLPGVQVLASVHLARTGHGDASAAAAECARFDSRLSFEDRAESRLELWRATGDRAHLAEARRALEHLVEHAPPDCLVSVVAGVRVHREIAAAQGAR